MSRTLNESSRVSLVRGGERYANLRRALDLVGPEVHLGHAQRIVVKPNLTSVVDQLSATHVDALRATLDFLRERTDRRIFVAEGSGSGSPPVSVGYGNFGYYELAKRYDVEFVDLNVDKPVTFDILDSHLKPLTIRLAQTMVEADYRVSLCVPKTHDSVIVTASLKNIAMGSLLRNQTETFAKVLELKRLIPQRLRTSRFMAPIKARAMKVGDNDKTKVHQGFPVMNVNLCRLARKVKPDLAVIDGFAAMEGDGPVGGHKVDWGIALASVDPVAADSLVSALMGFSIEEIGYLHHCHLSGLGQGDLKRIDVLGESFASCARRFRPHQAYKEQLKWQLPGVERYYF